jgi:hypothetical protein
VLIELYRNGKITEAFRAFRKIYLEVVDQIIRVAGCLFDKPENNDPGVLEEGEMEHVGRLI